MGSDRARMSHPDWDFYADPVAVSDYVAHREQGGSRNSLVEEPDVRGLLGDVRGLRCLDLGCGHGHYSRVLAGQGATVVGVDRSELMLAEAARRTDRAAPVRYVRADIARVGFRPQAFDLALSNLALHYLPAPTAVLRRVFGWLRPGGRLLFSVEHPVLTAHRGEQPWCPDSKGSSPHWAVSDYFDEGERWGFFGRKYHHTVATWLTSLLSAGFRVTGVAEPVPSEAAVAALPELAEDLHRPLFLILSGSKPDGGADASEDMRSA